MIGLPLARDVCALTLCGALAACASVLPEPAHQGPYAPGIDRSRPAVDGMVVGHRLMAAGEYDLAISAFTRAALARGMTADILAALGTANLRLGRLGQAETLLRRSVAADADVPGAWNNLGVVLMERGKIPEARLVFRKAYALDSGKSDEIRDNLRLSLAKLESSGRVEANKYNYKLVRLDSEGYAIRQTP